jgi:sulfatase maturation enzyme AslB (radical SAM superfamily)
MQDNLFEHILENYVMSLVKEGETVILHKDGEPLLHPSLFHYMSLLSLYKPDANIYLYTNGSLLTPEFLEDVGRLRNNVRIMISFHFEENNLAYDTERIHKLIDACGKNTRFIFVTHTHETTNIQERLAWQEFWLGVKQNVYAIENVIVNHVLNSWGGRVKDKKVVPFDACPYQDFAHMFIGVTGNVVPCCLDLDEEMIVGNVLRGRIDVITRLTDFYNALRKGNKPGKVCETCLI